MTVNSYSDVKICNAALRMIGSGGINSISEPTTDKEAICADIYPLARDTLLSSHEWNFNLVERTLAVDADKTPVQNYDYAHRLPSALLAGPYSVWGDGSSSPVFDYVNAEDYIHSDYAVVKIMCRIVPPVSIWPTWFIDLFMHDLAMRFAKPVADNTELVQEYRIKAYGPAALDGQGGMFGKAKLLDAKSEPVKTLFRNGDPLTSTRY